ncbi:MAG: hypothetical protein ACKOX3_12610, partial [Bacteroidota bacterium]
IQGRIILVILEIIIQILGELVVREITEDKLTPNPFISPRSNYVAPFLLQIILSFNSDWFQPIAVFYS